MNRNLDGYYFRVERDGKWQNICFTDLTTDEMEHVIENKSDEWCESLYEGLQDVLLDIYNLAVLDAQVVSKEEFESFLRPIGDGLPPKTKVNLIWYNINDIAETLDIIYTVGDE